MLSHINGHRTDRKRQKCLSGDESRLGGGEGRPESRKERIRTGQVSDKERSTHIDLHVRVTDV